MAETTNAALDKSAAPGGDSLGSSSVPTTVDADQLLITDHARAWMCAAVGWRVLPLKAETKRPVLKEWPKLATTDPVQIWNWWYGRFFGCVPGIATGAASQLWVLDIDRKWCDGRVSVRELFKRHDAGLPKTFRVRTPSLGEQWYFRYPTDGRRIGNGQSNSVRVGPLGPGLEWRGEGGQVVAPFTADRPVINPAAPIDAPAWLVELVTAKGEPVDYVTPEWHEDAGMVLGYARRKADQLAVVRSGGRNAELNRAAFALGVVGASGALTIGTAWTLLNEACQTNGLLADDGAKSFEDTFTSGWTAGLQAGGAS